MKKIIISLLSIIFIISMITNVYAATGNISAGASTDAVIKGKTFTVTLAATADSPIDGMYTKINYDKNVLSIESVTAGDNYGNNSSEGEILVTNNSTNTSPTTATLYTITFKVLDNANVDTTTISFSESELHLNVEGVVSSVASNIADITINIKSDETTIGGNNQDNSNQEQTQNPSNDNNGTGNDNNNDSSNSDNEENEENVNVNLNKNENKNENKNVSSNKNENKNTNKNATKLPQTGAESASVIAIIALGAISISSYISYRKYKNI